MQDSEFKTHTKESDIKVLLNHLAVEGEEIPPKVRYAIYRLKLALEKGLIFYTIPDSNKRGNKSC